MDNQNLSSASLSKTGSLTMPPLSSTSGTYMHCPTRARLMLRGVIHCTKRAASGPVIWTWRWQDTSHNCTCSRRCQ